jgi:hypothetical protein
MNFLNSINNLKDKLTPNKKSTEVLNDINVNYNYLSEESLTNLEVESPVKKRYGLRPQIKINYKDLNSSMEEKKMEEEFKKLRAELKSEQKYRQTIERELNSQKTESLMHKNLISDQEKELDLAKTEISDMKAQMASMMASINILKTVGLRGSGSGLGTTSTTSSSVTSTPIITTTTSATTATTAIVTTVPASSAATTYSSVPTITTSSYVMPISSNPALDTFLINQSVLQNKSMQYFDKINDTLTNLTVSKSNVIKRFKYGDNAEVWITKFENLATFNGWPTEKWKLLVGSHIDEIYANTFRELLDNCGSCSWNLFKMAFVNAFMCKSQKSLAKAKFKKLKVNDFKSSDEFVRECWRLAEATGDTDPQSIGMDIVAKLPEEVQRSLTGSLLVGEPDIQTVMTVITHAMDMESSFKDRKFSNFNKSAKTPFKQFNKSFVKPQRLFSNDSFQPNSSSTPIVNTPKNSLKCFHCEGVGHKRLECFFKDMPKEQAIFNRQIYNNNRSGKQLSNSSQGKESIKKPYNKQLNLNAISSLQEDVEYLNSSGTSEEAEVMPLRK